MLGRIKVCALYKGDLELPTDYLGMLYVPFESEDWQLKLAREIDQAGIQVDLNRLK